MNKFVLFFGKRFLLLLLVLSLVFPVGAVDVVPSENEPSGGSSGRAIVPPDDTGLGEGTLLFSLNAIEVKTFLPSTSWFRPLSLDSDVQSIFYSGRVYSSCAELGGHYVVSVGIGYYSEQNGDFIVVDSIDITHGEYFGSADTRMDIDDFSRTREYYAFIKNEYPNVGLDYAWGDVYVYASSVPG